MLIISLIILSSLSLLALGISYRSRLALRMAQFQFERTYVRELAEAGLALALEKLSRDQNEIDHLGEPWHADLSFEGWEEWLRDESLRFSTTQLLQVSCLDEEGKVNINAAEPGMLEKLAGLDDDVRACILDWADENDVPRLGGAEAAYYSMLRPPYRTKNKPMEIMPELMLVRGIDHQLYYGEDANQNRVLDPNEDDGVRRFPLDDPDGKLQLGLVDLLTVYGSGRVNLNTAPVQVLMAIPGLSEESAKAVADFRDGADGVPGTSDNCPFETMEQLKEIPGLSEFEQNILKRFCRLKSEHFRIVSRASIKEGKVACRLELLVHRAEGKVIPILRREGL